MDSTSAAESYYRARDELVELDRIEKRRDAEVEELIEPSRPVRVRIAKSPINLTWIEFRIIHFLSRKPYKAYTRKQIIEAVVSENVELTEGSLDDHIRSLRDKLGILSDYIQSVPYIGYRFKP
jgi:DNA-binding response OmpR family regulator